MELALPLFGAIKSHVSGHHLCYDQTKTLNFARSTGNNVFSTNSMVQFERAKTNSNYVHMRFCHSNKYWAKARSYSVAGASKSNKDINNPSSTMIAATLSDINKPDGELSVVGSKTVAFKGDNDKFLKVYMFPDNRYLQFSSVDGNESEAHFEVSQDAAGHHLIKSVSCGLYWRLSLDWILVDSTDPTDPNCWFCWAPIENSTIALPKLGINKYCERYTSQGMTDCLAATASTITAGAQLKMRELP